MAVTPPQDTQWVVPQNGDPTIANDKIGNTQGFNQDAWERANPAKAMAAAKTVAANKQMASKTFTPQWAPTTPATTTVRPDGTVIVEGSGDEEDTNRRFAVGKALWESGSGMPTPPSFNPEIDSTVFWDAAVERNQLDNKFLENRNQTIASGIVSKLGAQNIQNLSDSDIKKAIVQDLAQKGAPLDDPRILQTIYDIQSRVRQGQPTQGATQGQVQNTGMPKSSTDYFNDLTQWIPVSASNADAQNASQRYAKFSTYSVMSANELSVSISNNSLIPGDQTWTDLNNAGLWERLQQAQQLNTFQTTQRATSSVYPVLTTDSSVSLSSQQSVAPQQADIFGALMTNIAQGMNTNFAQMYQQMVVADPMIAKQRENVVTQQGKVAEIENQIASLQNELKNQIISSGGVVTDGYLSSLLAERTQPLERQLATANIQLGVSTNLLNMNMQLAQQTLSFAQQDFANKQASMGLITQIATSQAQLQQQAALSKQFVPESTFQSPGVFDPITGKFTPTWGSSTSPQGPSSSPQGNYTVDNQGNYDFSSITNPAFRTSSATQKWLAGDDAGLNNNNPGNLRAGDVGNGVSDSRFTIYSTPQEGWNALLKDVEAKKGNKAADYTLLSLAERYAPKSDGNNPANWAAQIGAQLWVGANTKISAIPTQELAKAITSHESPGMYKLLFGGSPAAQTAPGTNANSVASKYGVDAGQLASLANGSTSMDDLLKDPRNVKKVTAYQNAARELNPSRTPQTFEIIQQFKDPKSQVNQGINAINTMFNHLGELKEVFGSLNTLKYPWLNQKIQKLQESWFGDKNADAQKFLGEYNALKSFLASEQAKAAKGEGWLSLEEVSQAQSLLNSAESPAAFLGKVEGITKIIAGKMGTLVWQWKQTTNAPLNQADWIKNPSILKNTWLTWDPNEWVLFGGSSSSSTQWGGGTIWDLWYN